MYYQNPGYYQQQYYDPRVDVILANLGQIQNAIIQQHAFLNCIKQEQEYMKEEAYSKVSCEDQRYVVSDKRGNKHTIIGAIFESVFYFTFKSPHTLEPHYVILLRNNPKPLVISESNFLSPKILLNSIALASGQNPAQFKSTNITAALLRTYISSSAFVEEIPFYKGWNENMRFEVFSNGTTHGVRVCEPVDTKMERPTIVAPSSSLHAAEQFVQLMDTIATPGIQTIICLWFHACAMSSLLSKLKYPVPMGICFYSTDSRVNRYLESFFSWYGDPVIPLALEKKQFLDALLERKDQPCLLRDQGDYSGNAAIVESALRTGKITMGKDTTDLASLPTVLSNASSSLCVSPFFATIEIDYFDFVACTGEHLSALSQYVFDYVVSFNQWVEGHVDTLRSCVSRGIDTVIMDDSEQYQDLSEEGINTLGILFGVRQIVVEFYRSLGFNELAYQHVLDIIMPRNTREFVSALSSASNCLGDVEDIASMFLNIVAHMRSRDEFDWRMDNNAKLDTPCEASKVGIVYQSDQHIGFTRPAFVAISRRCGLSSPQLLKKLAEAGLRKCPLASQPSKQNRMTVHNADGRECRVYVYKFEEIDIPQ